MKSLVLVAIALGLFLFPTNTLGSVDNALQHKKTVQTKKKGAVNNKQQTSKTSERVVIAVRAPEQIARQFPTTGENKVFDVVEKMPEYPGGIQELIGYLQNNVNYPKDAFEAKCEGRVIVSFVIEKDGTISNTRIANSVFPSLDEEAKRVVSAMPKWSPGVQGGKNVRVKMCIPIVFKL